MIDELFAILLKKYSLNEIYKMDVLELLRLSNLEKTKRTEVRKTDSLFSAFGK